MGLLKMFKKKKPKIPKPIKPDTPDYASYWKEYSGWIQNVNDTSAGQMADVRARLSAAGASPDVIMQQTEFLEAQRKNEISRLEGGPTFGILKEGFDIASGAVKSPYKGGPPGFAAGQPAPTDASSYYTGIYGAAAKAPDPGIDAAARAKAAAAGVSAGPAAAAGAAGGSSSVGSTSETGLSSVFAKKETFWG